MVEQPYEYISKYLDLKAFFVVCQLVELLLRIKKSLLFVFELSRQLLVLLLQRLD